MSKNRITYELTKEMSDALATDPVEHISAWWKSNATPEERKAAEERGATPSGAFAFVESVARKAKHKSAACLPDALTYQLAAIFLRNGADGDEFVTPDELKQAERAIVRGARAAARRIIDRWMREGRIRKAYKVVIPQSETELIAEGEAMHNCVGRYFSRIKSGACTLAFIRKNGKPYIDIEIAHGKIVQMRYDRNIAVKTTTVDGRLCKLVEKAFSRKAV